MISSIFLIRSKFQEYRCNFRALSFLHGDQRIIRKITLTVDLSIKSKQDGSAIDGIIFDVLLI